MKPGEKQAYRGYLITATRSGVWGDPLFYISKDVHYIGAADVHYIGAAATLDGAKKIIDELAGPTESPPK